MGRSIVRGLLLVMILLWGALIFRFSSQSYQQQTIIPYLKQHVTEERLSQELPDLTLEYDGKVIRAKQRPYSFVEFVFRKLMHLFMYGMLALILYIALGQLRVPLLWRAAAVLFVVAAVALADEWNQSEALYRNGSLHDVLLDLAGGGLGLLLGIAMSGAAALLRGRGESLH